MMNKLIKTVLVGGLVFSATASAADFTPYVGAEVLANKSSFKKADTNLGNNDIEPKKSRFGLGVFGGARFTENLGVEAGFQNGLKKKANNARGNEVSTKFNNLYLDAVGYMPVSEEVELIGKAGLGRMKAKITVANETVTNKDKLEKAKVGLRLGAGAQYKIDDNLAARLMLTYQKANKELLKSNVAAGVGVTWSVL